MHQNRLLVAALLAGCCLFGPAPVTSAESGRSSDATTITQPSVLEALALSDRAEQIHGSQLTQMTYTVIEPYPAEDLLKELTGKLDDRGWKALHHDPLNPHLETFAVHRWTEFADAQREDERVRVDQWTGWFKDSQGSQLMLLLRYTDRGSESPERVTVVLRHDATVRGSAPGR